MYFENLHPGYPAPEICVLVRPKLNFLGWHWGLLLPNGFVLHSTAQSGVHVVSQEDFAAGMPVRVERRVPVSDFIDTLWRAQHELFNAEPYHLMENNCETVVNRVTGQGSISGQVQAALTVALVALLAFAAANS